MGPKRTKERKKKGDKQSLDETTLAQLTSQIDKSLADSEKQRPPKRKIQRDTDDGHDPKRRQTRPSERDSQGDGRKNEQASALLDEILALGGDEDDLELVANVDSGDEGGEAPRPKVSSDPTVDKSLNDELAQFASSLGFTKFRENEDPETDEDSEAAEDASGNSAMEDNKVEEETRRAVPPPQEARQGKKAGKLVFDPRPDWHGLPLDGLSTRIPGNSKQHSASISNLKAYAEKLLEGDSSSYLAKRASSSTQKFMSTIMSSGTLSDKVSALTLSIQESPLHNCKAFESLITLAGKRSRGQAIAALGALVDLLGNGTVLPGDRRLHPFNAQPALLGAMDEQGGPPWVEGHKLPGKLTESHLMMWAYEDWLKGAYFRIIQLLEIWCSDEIEYSRSRALDFVFGLLKNKPEQEANLLRLLVNKLGDRERKITSRASYLLLQLLNIHPGMKAIVISAVEQEVMLKPGQSLRTKYAAINTLNQTILSMKEPAIADTLLRIYFDVFLSLLKTGSLGDFEVHDGDNKSGRSRKKPKKKGAPATPALGNEQETAQKLVSSLLTGVNRAVPFAGAEDSTLEKHLDTLFRITHSSNFNTSVQALMLIQQLATSKQLAVDRFYRTLYESLLDPRLITSSKHALYLNLLFRAMKNDVDVRRVKAFVKRLIQVLSLHQPSFTCGILFLIAELQTTFPDLRTLLDEPEDNDDDGEEVYRDIREDDPQAGAASQATPETSIQRTAAYDGRKRNPEHSNAHRSCLWELAPFLTHYHPSVCVFAGNLLARQKKALPKPDLANHSLMHFLDKFVYRNPKAEESKRGGSIMQPILASGSASHIVASSKAAAKQQRVVNSSSFWNLKPEQVSADDVFFHEYFARAGKPGEASRIKKTADDDQAVSDDEAAGEEEIWDALVNSQPEIEGADAEEDSEMDLEEYDYSDDDMDVDGLDAGEKMSDLGSEGSDGDAGFEGIFDDSAESDEASPSEDEDEDEVEAGAGKEPIKQGRKGRLNRKEMKGLPTFASADDYAEMLAAEDDMDG
ncbi:CBF/Mak21 family-domain-containing protein [Chaetomidium leptoderma]|uniref:CBF/Mak21 family-domain-containing protein n=1 Tax=Chaetomidium leptoderma TaxID=669021 RepID=A0AAN6VCQ4_9PEZI|nr:CBF/Mak21 family-domain-containing protein [Chaetomidium leptoderma]